MRVKQEAWFSIRSGFVSASEITKRLGIFPDEAHVKGADAKTHGWQINARGNPWAPLRGEGANEARFVTAHLADIERRLSPVADAIRLLTNSEGTSAVLRVVRWYFPSKDEADLSFHLDGSLLRFLLATGSEFDVSEYDMTLADDLELAAARDETWGEN